MGFLFLISLRVEDNSVFFENYLVYSAHKQEVILFLSLYVCLYLCVYEYWALVADIVRNVRMKTCISQWHEQNKIFYCNLILRIGLYVCIYTGSVIVSVISFPISFSNASHLDRTLYILNLSYKLKKFESRYK